MSIQFRSRIRSVADYGNYGLGDIGICCYPDNDGTEDPSCIGYSTCIANNGWWRAVEEESCNPSQYTCPDLAGQGCCCNCTLVGDFSNFYEAVDAGGLNVDVGTQDMTYCECMDIGGQWSPVLCDSVNDKAALCFNPDEGVSGKDVRWPNACCHDGICTDVCIPEECAVFGAGNSMYLDKVCSRNTNDDEQECYSYLDEYVCQGGNPETCWCYQCSGAVNMAAGSALLDDGETPIVGRLDPKTGLLIMGPGDDIGAYEKLRKSSKLNSACIYKQRTNIVCSQKLKDECPGCWSGMKNDTSPYGCEELNPQEILRFFEKRNVPSTTVDAWKIGQQVLGIGRYVGNFQVSSDKISRGSTCIGTSPEGNPTEYYATSKGIGSVLRSRTTYAVIVTNQDSGIHDYGMEISYYKNTSSWDSINNIKKLKNYSSTFKDVFSTTINGIDGWTIPSKDLLGFMTKQFKNSDWIKNTSPTKGLNRQDPFYGFEINAFYYSSTIQENKYAWTQRVNNFYPEENEQAICPTDHGHRIRLVQLVPIIP